MHNMSVYELPRYYQLKKVPSTGTNYFNHVIDAPQTSTYENIVKLLTHSILTFGNYEDHSIKNRIFWKKAKYFFDKMFPQI